MRRAETEFRLSHISRGDKVIDASFGDKLAEWRRRFDWLRLMELRVSQGAAELNALHAGAIALRRDMARNRTFYLAMLSVSEPAIELERARTACARIGSELDELVARLSAG